MLQPGPSTNAATKSESCGRRGPRTGADPNAAGAATHRDRGRWPCANASAHAELARGGRVRPTRQARLLRRAESGVRSDNQARRIERDHESECVVLGEGLDAGDGARLRLRHVQVKYGPVDLVVALLVGAITCGVMGFAVVRTGVRGGRELWREFANA